MRSTFWLLFWGIRCSEAQGTTSAAVFSTLKSCRCRVVFFFNSRLFAVIDSVVLINLKQPWKSFVFPSSLRDVKAEFVIGVCELPSSSPPRTSLEFLGTAGWTSGWVGCCCLCLVWMIAPAGAGCHPLYPTQVLLAFIRSHAAVSSKLELLRLMQWEGELIA